MPSIIKKKIDRLGQIRAEMADLKEEADKIREYLINKDIDEADGDLFHVKISHRVNRRVNYSELLEDYEIGEDDIEPYVQESESYQLNVTAR